MIVVMMPGVFFVREVSVTEANCAEIYTAILLCVEMKQIFAERVDWEIPKMIGMLGGYRVQDMVGMEDVSFVERKRWEKGCKITEKENEYLLGSSSVVYDCSMLLDQNRERLFKCVWMSGRYSLNV